MSRSRSSSNSPDTDDGLEPLESNAGSAEHRVEGQLDATSSILDGHESEEDDDLTIEEYMSRLLQRTNGPANPGEPAVVAAKPEPPAEDDLLPSQLMPSGDEPVSASLSPAPAESRPKAPAKPREAPERQSDMNGLREIANISARTALGDFSSRRMVLELQTTRSLAVLAMAASMWLLTAASGVRSWEFAAAGGALIGGGFFVLRYIAQSRRLFGLAQSVESQNG